MPEQPRPQGRAWLPPLTLLAVTAVYGWTFVVIKAVLAEYPVLPYLGLRFGIAVVVLFLLLRRRPARESWKVGLPVGAVLAVGYLFQTEGMVSIKPGIAGLLTGLFVVFTPILDRVVFGTRLRLRTGVSVLVALGGTYLLTGAGGHFSGGDLLVVASALAFAAQIVLLSRRRDSPVELGVVQMAVCAVAFLCLGTTSGVPYPPVTGAVALALLITGVLASALAILAQTWAQQRMSASRAGVLLAAEPVLALGFAVVLTNETLTSLQLVGAGLVMVAILGHEIAFKR
ncbi:MAG TPA: DMT family transporter [Candidatus Dormibacteraeota bacterium]